MASPPQKVEEFSSWQDPCIQFGDFPPDFFATLIEETLTPPKNQEHSISQPVPISPQLRFAQIMRKPTPRFLPPPPPSLTPTPSTSCKLFRVPSRYCCDNRAPGDHASYLSRDPLLKKMYERNATYRTAMQGSKSVKNMNQEFFTNLHGPLVKYWLTFPLKLQTRSRQVEEEEEEPPFLLGSDQPQPSAIACATVPIKCCRDELEKNPVVGLERFHWVKIRNFDGTQFRSLKKFHSFKDKVIWGHVECRKCEAFSVVTYFLPSRFATVSKYVIQNRNYIELNGGKALCNGLGFFCLCDGEMNPEYPFISEDLSKINWLFLFLGKCLGHCTLAQLQYFCNKRKLGTSGGKNRLMLRICFDICKQLDPEFIVPEDFC